MSIKRFGVSMEKSLLSEFDRFIKRHGYKNRSEAIRDLVREKLIEEEWEGEGEVTGALFFVYDHSNKELVSRILTLGHSLIHEATSSFHVHLDPKHCLEIFILRGEVEKVRKIADKVRSMKGVKVASLVKISGQKIL